MSIRSFDKRAEARDSLKLGPNVVARVVGWGNIESAFRTPLKQHRSRLAWVFVVGGALFVSSNAYDISRAIESHHWPTVSGTVTALSVRPDRIVPPQVPRVSRRLTGILFVRYVYVVSGREHEGSRVSFATPWLTRRLLETSGVGRVVSVHYDPADPSDAVLSTSVPAGRIAELVLGVLVVVYAALLAIRPEPTARGGRK